MTAAATRPASEEHAPEFGGYTSLVPEGDVVGTLSKQITETLSLLRSIPEEDGNKSYEDGKWSIKELIGHVIDAERIFSYRALRFARGDATPLAGFEQDDFIRGADFNNRSLRSLADELEHVRATTVDLFRNLSEEAWLRRGVANENEISVRAIAYILAGHELHHVNVLKERYLSK
jgi:hypothetical protein